MLMGPDAKEERLFEKNLIARQEERYLNTDVIEKCQQDKGYAEKIDLIERYLQRLKNKDSLVLDLGANTGGEAEVLVTRGYKIVATDINEIALSFSNIRSKKFRSVSPIYIAADAHRLPFEDNTFQFVIAFEVLHHFENLQLVLSELSRVLKPGGMLFSLEPFALNPYRRLAEMRFLFLGSIERSFRVRPLAKALEQQGFTHVDITKVILPPSEWKKSYSTWFRRILKNVYYLTRKRSLRVFGDLLIFAEKGPIAATSLRSEGNYSVFDRLICPITGSRLKEEGDGFISTGRKKYFYRKYNDIPVLVGEDAIPVRDSETNG